jgi:stage III sporulation protein AB
MVRTFFTELARALDTQTAPDVQVCVYTLLTRMEPPKLLRRQLAELGATLGRFDLPGQLRGLEHAIRSAEEALRTVRDGAEGRRRSWQTLGLCAGAALAILFV